MNTKVEIQNKLVEAQDDDQVTLYLIVKCSIDDIETVKDSVTSYASVEAGAIEYPKQITKLYWQ